MTPGAQAVCDVFDEFARAEARFAPFNSAHEGISVIREEFEELWQHVKDDSAYSDEAYEEAMQLGAMAARFMVMVRKRQEAGRAAEKGTN